MHRASVHKVITASLYRACLSVTLDGHGRGQRENTAAPDRNKANGDEFRDRQCSDTQTGLRGLRCCPELRSKSAHHADWHEGGMS